MTQSAVVVAACFRRDLKVARSYRLAFALQVVAVLAGLAIFAGVGQIVSGSRIATSTGVRGGYFAFASIGIAITGIVNVTCGAFARRVREDQTTGVFEAVLASPVSARLAVVAGAVYEIFKALLIALFTVLFAVVIFGVDLHLRGATILVLLVGLPGLLAILAAIGVFVAALGVVYKDPGSIVALATAGVALISGAYFPVSVMPQPLESIAKVLPFTWGLDVLRGGLLGAPVATWKCLALLGIGALVFPFALWLWDRAVDRARMSGSLGLY